MTTEIIAVWAEGHNQPANPLGSWDRIMGNSETNSMPWPHSHEDLQQFTRDTARHVMVMGRNTFQSLPKLMTEGLAGRITTQHRPMVVLSADPAYCFAQQAQANLEGLDITFGLPGSPERVLAWIKAHRPDRDVAVIGGPDVIELFRHHYDRLLITWHQSRDGWPGDVRAPFTMGELRHDWAYNTPKRISPTLTQHIYSRKAV